MTELRGTMFQLTLLLLVTGCVSATRFSIMAPNVFHIGVEEKVSVTVFDAGKPVTVKLYLQDYPHRRKTFSAVQAVLPPQPGSNSLLTVKVEPKDLPDTNSVDKQYVYLVAKSDDAHFQFRKEAKILLSYRDGMVFKQTDKTIYTPRQRVRIQVIPLDFDMKPSIRKISLVVMNPQEIIVKQWKDLGTSTGFITKVMDNLSTLGKWTITAIYGHQNIHSTSVQFEVKEYVLPRFSINVSVPPYILKTDKDFKVKITARYTYKEPVVGATSVHLSIKTSTDHVIPFATNHIVLDRNGTATIEETVKAIQQLAGDYWFPEKGRLLVQADVIEYATGNKGSVVDKSCQFTSSPYFIAFKNTPKYFKPGLPFIVKVVVTDPNKQQTRSVPVKMSAIGIQGNQRKDLKGARFNPAGHTTNEDGEVEFVVDTCRDCQSITITVETADQALSVSQNAVANYTAEAFDSDNGPLIKIRQIAPGKIGRKIVCESFRSGNYAGALFSFAVVSRGRILSHKTTDSFYGPIKTWSFIVSSEMSPSARVIGYYIDSNERVAADSILLDIEDKLPTKVDFPDATRPQADGTLIQVNEVEKVPGEHYEIRIKAPQGTILGLLSVDQSVYLLRNENRLSEERIFKTAEELDLGCGAGGGKDNNDIFKNAGVVLMTNNFVSGERKYHGCDDNGSRKKRRSGRSLGLGDLDPSDEEIIDQTYIRSYFPETWAFLEDVVGPSGTVRYSLTVPDAITTLIVQAVAINNETGLGLATPLRIVTKRNLFVSIKMPYSVKRGEQVSLLATAFNYYEEEIRAKIYLKGDNEFCSFAADKKLGLIGTVTVPPNDARSVAVPIFPKIIGEVEIKVSSIFQLKFGDLNVYVNGAGDSVTRRLLVEEEKIKRNRTSQSYALDPKVRQLDIIELNVPTMAIPSSIKAVLYLSGNLSINTITGSGVKNAAGNVPLDLRVKIVTELHGIDIAHHITRQNALSRKEINVPSHALGEKLYVKTVGTGVGLLEVELSYDLLSSREKTCKFDLSATVKEINEQNAGGEEKTGKEKRGKKGKSCRGKNKKRCRDKRKGNEKDKDKKKEKKNPLVKSILLKVCTRNKEERKGRLAIMDVGILNGFVLDVTSLQKLRQNSTLPELDKLEVLDRSLVIPFSEIPNDRKVCIDVQFNREFYVGAVQAVPVKVYDYYKPDSSCSVFYGPGEKFSPLKLGECNAGSRSCNCSQDPNRMGCAQVLRNLLKNPPRFTYVAINIQLSMARYRCFAGFVLSGKEMRTCKDGRWIEEKEPVCMGPCGKPKRIPHSKYIGSSFKFKDKLRYVCDKDYTLKGPRMRECGEHGRWSKAPTCFKDYSVCGESSVNMRSIPVGRKRISKRGWWPWQIAIYKHEVAKSNVQEKFYCGGALISRQWVLTSAHCFYRKHPGLYVIKAGIYNLSRAENSEQKMSLDQIFIHEKYNSSLYVNDIALLKLNRPLKLTKFVRTVCFQENDERDLAIPETHGIASGWGIIKPLKLGGIARREDFAKVLRYSSLKIQNDQLCTETSKPYFINSTVTFCVADAQKRSGTCTGDSGGALVQKAQRGVDKRWAWVATGVISWGIGCAQKNLPGYYTRVYPFIDWIKKTMDNN